MLNLKLNDCVLCMQKVSLGLEISSNRKVPNCVRHLVQMKDALMEVSVSFIIHYHILKMGSVLTAERKDAQLIRARDPRRL